MQISGVTIQGGVNLIPSGSGGSGDSGGSGGLSNGYSSGGSNNDVSGAETTIEKFPFASEDNATYVGDLTESRSSGGAGQSSDVSGYTAGATNTIDKFPFASDDNATDVGDLTQARYYIAGNSSSVSGYSSGGWHWDLGTPGTANIIDKFPFSSDTNATDVGDLSQTTDSRPAGQSSTDNGYVSGGFIGGWGDTTHDKIDKFPFSSDSNATNIGNLTSERKNASGQSSSESGYTSGGRGPVSTGQLNTIDKFPFASDANATDVGDLTSVISDAAGQSSSSNGYSSAGSDNDLTPYHQSMINKFPFTSDSNATDVGDLTLNRSGSAGQQG